MAFPSPTERQGKILWLAVTSVAGAALLALLVGLVWAVGQVLQGLSSVLLPLAIAGILAYLLDPVVDFFERRRVPRTRAILAVYVLAVMLILLVLFTIIPRLIIETKDLLEQLPTFSEQLQKRINVWLMSSAMGAKAKAAWASEFGNTVQSWLAKVLPVISGWMLAQISKVASWFGLIVGLALVPVYLFYFLVEKSGIQRNWTDYLPFTESKMKDEIVFILNSINDYLILFFRGQILVALCDGVLLTVGFLAIGLNYAILLGMTAGLLGIVPFLGVVSSLIPALALAAVQYGDWLHPALVLGLFGLVQALEGLFISPRIMGDRVGLHPLTIIVAVMVGTTLMGGIIGGILAIPLTAALRVLMFRYVWKKPTGVILPS